MALPYLHSLMESRSRPLDGEAPGQRAGTETARAYDLRTLRILALLEERTDRTTALTSTDIRRLLARPDEPGIPPVCTTGSSVRYSINALRAAGLTIEADNHRGYALTERAIPESDMELMLHALWTSTALGAEQRKRLTGELLPLAPPSLRERFKLLTERRTACDPTAPDTERFVLESPEQLVRRAIGDERCIRFELTRPGIPDTREGGQSSPDALPGDSRQIRLVPESLFESRGAVFVRGRTECGRDPRRDRAPLPLGVDARRTFLLDRMANLAMRDGEGIIHLAPSRPRADAGPLPIVNKR